MSIQPRAGSESLRYDWNSRGLFRLIFHPRSALAESIPAGLRSLSVSLRGCLQVPEADGGARAVAARLPPGLGSLRLDLSYNGISAEAQRAVMARVPPSFRPTVEL